MMKDQTRVITIAGIATLLALPLSYMGINHNSGLLWFGVMVFVMGLITPIVLRMLRKN
jgi:hypothetical protein